MTDTRRALPSVNALLESDAVRALMDRAPRALVVSAVRTAIDRARQTGTASQHDSDAWTTAVACELAHAEQRSLRKVINATGVVLHTNLGRAPLARVAVEAMTQLASGYSNLEYDLERGSRGSRYVHCASLLRELTGAEDALVVNNGAAALVLALNTLCDGREAILSRGELVEIGGSFRVHEIMAKSGAKLREIGSTNRTHVADYESAASSATGAVLKVHRSNFTQGGYVAEVSVRELASLAHSRGLPIVHDLGSGLMIPLDSIGLSGEPTAAEALSEGASVVTMSGDKLLGGPQAGIILGSSVLLEAMRKNPLARAFRVDKFTLAALEATLALYRDPARALAEIPTLQLLGTSVTRLRERATRVMAALQGAGIGGALVDTTSSVGGGAFPSVELPSIAIALDAGAQRWHHSLRRADPAVIGRVSDDRMLLDMRAVPDDDVPRLAASVVAARD